MQLTTVLSLQGRLALQGFLKLSAVLFFFVCPSCADSGSNAKARSESSAPVEVSVNKLEKGCQGALAKHAPDAATDLVGPDVYRDFNDDLSVGWSSSSGEFYKNSGREASAAKAIATACSKVVVVVYSGPTGGSERWYIRRDGFSVRHSRDSGLPGDEAKYWGWDKVLFNYDPQNDYQ